ncbi:hypothetical protein EZV62_006572 [Acer yangbiense]|uniref:RRM domain-containing protein n=1 Tax=Acer yangbiense TaxID=1000413 RepID=A0A5C7I834_9ROSI|nr:hypothetical protein EZV62_006572 [Acer yangbiense]
MYVTNLDVSIDDEKLKELFSEFGTITSCKVMREPSGISRGSGFVAFSTPEEASRARQEMNGKMIVGKPLNVAQRSWLKAERRARPQTQFSQMRPVAMAPSVAPRMPMYPPGALGPWQQFMYGQGPPAIIPPHAGFGYQQQLVPGMRPGGDPMPNFFVPMVQQGQRPGAGPVQQSQQPVPLMQQQMLPRGRVYRYPPGRNMPDVPMPGMLPVPYDMGAGMAMRDATVRQPMPITALSTALANASPEQQRTLLGESLYPQVEQLERDAAAKVTDIWDSQSVEIFCDLCIKEVEEGHCPGTHFTKVGWDNLVKNFSKATGKEYNKVQLKNRWDTLKSDWKLLRDLVGKETGLGWNAKLKTIDASEEWWHRKLQVHPNAAKFRKEGIDLATMEKLDRMCKNTIATEDHAWSPSSGVLPSDSSNTDTIQVESTADSEESVPVDVTQDVESVEKGGNKRMINKYNTLGVRDRKGKNVVAREGGKVKTSTISTKSIATSQVQNDTVCSITEAMQKLISKTGLKPSDELWLFASRLFSMKDKKEVFSLLEDPEDMLTWLRYEKEHGLA